jgi:hypothetical protein
LKEKRENSLNTDIEREKTRKGKRKKRKENKMVAYVLSSP